MKRTIPCLAALCLATAPVSAQRWAVVGQPGGYQVARVDGTGAIAGLGLTCEKGTPVLALKLARPAARSPAAATITVDRATTRLAVVRNGTTDVWVAGLGDPALLDAIASAPAGTRIAIAVDGGQGGVFASDGAGDAMRQALAGCYRASGRTAASAAAPTPAARSAIDETSLPTALRQDLADFRASCRGWKYDWTGVDRGQPVVAAGWFVRADFNGDGATDYLADARKWRCSKEQGPAGPHLMLYTSQPDGGHRMTLQVPDVESFQIVAGPKAGLRIHRNAMEDDEEMAGHPAITETLTMIDATRWTASASHSALPDWRIAAFASYPAAIGDLAASWDRQCAATGRRLVGVEEMVTSVRRVEIARKMRDLPIDLNADGKRDYVVDTDPVMCGPFGSNPQIALASAPPKGVLIAIVSRPDGSYALSPIPKSVSLQPSEEPSEIQPFNGRDVICFYEDTMAANAQARLVRYSWSGTVATRTVVPDRVQCDGKRY